MRVWQRWPYLWGAMRGLAVGLVATAAAVGVAVLIVWAYPVDDGPCDSDLACLPDLTGLLFALGSLPVVVGVGGPVAARLLGAPRPLLYALPVLATFLWVCVAAGPAQGQAAWPFGSLGASAVILLAPYAVIGLFDRPAEAKARAGAPE